ncbi:MAG: Stage V sporulation protein D [Syntrophomonadaceae bacterium]|nr:Stage V sporulation protein D [Bacillota bacterium]
MKRHTVASTTVRKRLTFLLGLAVLVVFALTVRLFWIQVVIAGDLREKAWDQIMRRERMVAPRGNIFDRKGRLLAGSASSVSVLAYPAQITDKEEAARLLAPILALDEAVLLERLSRRTGGVYLRRKITEEAALEIRKLELAGIRFTLEPKRYYPHNNLASQLIGFMGLDDGRSGLEYKYEQELRGRDGLITFESDGLGRQIPQGVQNYTPPVDGNDLFLTIDRNIQFIVEQEMERTMQELQPKGINVIALDPRSGEVLAIAGTPSFDPNNFADYPEKNWRLSPVTDTFEPGSTFKLVTLAAAIEEGKFRANEGFYCSGSMLVAGRTIGCWTRSKGGHGAIDFTKVVLGSCNPGFITLGQQITAPKLSQYIEAFGFGQRSGIDALGEGVGILFTPEQLGPVEAATTTFGQGISVTPLQQVMAVAAMANGGYLMRPYVVREIRDSQGATVRKNEPQMVRRVVSAATAREVARIMELVVTEGSGINAFIEGYRLAGKTGTAQKIGTDGRYIAGEYILSFIGFAPVEEPQVLIYIAVDAPQVGVQWGSLVAAPMFKQMMERILAYLDIPPAGKMENVPPKMVDVPALVGLTVDEASTLLDAAGLRIRFIGSGEEILNQTPKAGAKVPLHTQILVHLGGEEAQEEVLVPALIGKTMREAGEVLGWLGLRMNSSGSGVAVSQEPKPQSLVPTDTVINVKFASPGETELER